MSNVEEDNQKLNAKIKNLENDLEQLNKHRKKVERVLKHATDSLVIALSVKYFFFEILILNVNLNIF